MLAELLVVDDDAQSLESTARILEMAGYRVTRAADGEKALDLARNSIFDVVISDVRMPKMDGIEFLRALTVLRRGLPMILMTAYGQVDEAVTAMKLGAVDFLSKPFKRQALLDAVSQALKKSEAVRRVGADASLSGQSLLIGTSRSIDETRRSIEKFAPTSAIVLITGESGTGKELIARSIHQMSPRLSKPFIALNCAAIPADLIESELFGHEKGAFTGADSAKIGIFEAAHLGTLFLDEIGDMPLNAQAKLLRVLQENEVRRIGSVRSQAIDVRVIAATHQDLAEKVIRGEFRQDLLYRLQVLQVSAPPLRDRGDDLFILADYFLKHFAERHGKAVAMLSAQVRSIFKMHPWLGNVRELQNVIERAVILASGDTIEAADLPPYLRNLETQAQPYASGTIEIPIGASLKDVEDLLIKKTLEATSGDKSVTAKILGINSRTIYRKLGSSKEN